MFNPRQRAYSQPTPPKPTGVFRPHYPVGVALHDALVYAYSTTFPSSDRTMTLAMRSPGLRRPGTGQQTDQDIPIFGLRDTIGGTVVVHNPSPTGQLVVTLEGTLYYTSPSFSRRFFSTVSHPMRHQHTFLSSTFVFSPESATHSINGSVVSLTAPKPLSRGSRIRNSLKRAFSGRSSKDGNNSNGGGGGGSPAIRSRSLTGGVSALNGASHPPNSHLLARSFSFQIPTRTNQEIPPSFYASVVSESDGVRGRASVESAEVQYRVTAQWEDDQCARSRVIAPFLFLPDPSYTALKKPSQWSETPLTSRRPLPWRCALCLPHPRTFARDHTIPFAVTFTTEAGNRSLARDIASEAHITVTLTRQLHFDPAYGLRTSYSSIASSNTTSTSHSSEAHSSQGGKWNLLKRVATTTRMSPFSSTSSKSTSHSYSASASASYSTGSTVPTEPSTTSSRFRRDKPLPSPPPEAVTSEDRTIQTKNSIGFPKRPRKHASASGATSTGILFEPLGSWKGHLDLSNEALPSIQYGGASVKYIVTARVRYGGDEVVTQVDVKVLEPHVWWERGETVRHGGP